MTNIYVHIYFKYNLLLCLYSRWEEEVSKRQQMESLVETLQEVRSQPYYIATVLMFDIHTSAPMHV